MQDVLIIPALGSNPPDEVIIFKVKKIISKLIPIGGSKNEYHLNLTLRIYKIQLPRMFEYL